MVLDNAYALCSALLSIIAKHVGNKKKFVLEASITSANLCMKSASSIKKQLCVFKDASAFWVCNSRKISLSHCLTGPEAAAV